MQILSLICQQLRYRSIKYNFILYSLNTTDASLMHWNQAPIARDEMLLSPITHGISPATPGSSESSASSGSTTEGIHSTGSSHVETTLCTPSPLVHNVIISATQQSVPLNDRGAPPSYEEAIDPNAPPPSYDSLFGRMRDAHKVSKRLFDFLKDIIVLLLGTIGCTIMLGVTTVLPICMMIIGGLYLYDCPQGEYIPVYLLVGGGFMVFKQLLDLSAKVRQRQEERDEERIRQSPTQTLINCFMLGWFIIGSMWVYKEYEPNYDPSQGKYCNKTLYLFAFWLTTTSYICLGVLTAALCSISVASIAFQRPRLVVA